MLVVITLVALYFGLRIEYIGTAFNLDLSIRRANQLPPLFAFCTVCLVSYRLDRSWLAQVSWGTLGGVLVSVAMIFELAFHAWNFLEYEWEGLFNMAVNHTVTSTVASTVAVALIAGFKWLLKS